MKTYRQLFSVVEFRVLFLSQCFMVMSGSVNRGGLRMGFGATKSLVIDDVNAIEAECPSVAAVAPGTMTSSQVVYGNDNWATRIIGTSPNYFTIRAWPLQGGVYFDEAQVEQSSNVAVIGETVRKFVTAQMARTLGTLLGGGIPLVNSLEVTARSVGNHHMGRELDVVTQSVREGQGLAASLTKRAVVPDVALKMIEVGESTGSLQDMLGSLADFYDEEVETSVSRFVTLIEPMLLVAMGAVIAMLVLALYMPLFQLSSVVNQ